MALEDRLYPLLALYDRCPEAVRQGLGWLYRTLPASLKWGHSYRGFRELALGCPDWTSSTLRDYQFGEVATQIQTAWNHCPRYRETFSKAGVSPADFCSLGDLKKFPFLQKEDLQKHLEGLTNQSLPAKSRLYITTGGSTGVPVGFYLQRGISRPKEQAFLEAMWMRVGYSPEARVAVVRGHVTSPRSSGRIHAFDATRGWLLLSSSHLEANRLPEYLHQLEKFRPDFLHVYPSAALKLAELMTSSGCSWKLPLRALLCGSERLTDTQKKILEDFFGCAVFRWYGHSERAALAGEGWDTPAFYFWPTYGYVEFGEPDEDGLREIIATSFHNRVMPLIRYRTGDKVRLAETSGIGGALAEVRLKSPQDWPCAVEFAGRDQEFLVTATGRQISLTTFNMHDDIFDGLYAIQFRQDVPGTAELCYVPSPQFQASRLPMILSRVQKKTGDDLSVVLVEVSETTKTPAGKHQWLVSTLGRSSPERKIS